MECMFDGDKPNGARLDLSRLDLSGCSRAQTERLAASSGLGILLLIGELILSS